MDTPKQREEAAYDEPCAPRRCLQEGYDTRASSPPDPRVRVSPGATRRAVRAATTPSRRERALPPPVHPKTDQVFTPANTHHHRTPHPVDHATHTTMATGQHLTTGSAQEHRGATPRAAALASKTLNPPHSIPTATSTKDTSGKEPPFAPLGCP